MEKNVLNKIRAYILIWPPFIFMIIMIIFAGTVSFVLFKHYQKTAEVWMLNFMQPYVYQLGEELSRESVHKNEIHKILDAIIKDDFNIFPNPPVHVAELELNDNTINQKLFKKGQSKTDDQILRLPIYHKDTMDLIAVLNIYCSPDWYRSPDAIIPSNYWRYATLIALMFIVIYFIYQRVAMKFYKKTESKIQQKQTQFIQAGRLAAMGEMATGIAHELNQPLSIIRLAADGLKSFYIRQALEPEAREALQDIITQVKRGDAIINNMRAFARKPTELNELINLIEPMERAISFFREQFRIHQILLKVEYPEVMPKVKATAQKFEQIVVNLLSNARYAVEKKAETSKETYQKKITVRLFADNVRNVIIFEVEDNGVGMTPEVMNRCMEPFFTTKTVGEGTGLGLSIVNSITRELKMRIEVESIPKSGSVFHVIIPYSHELVM